jgi:hypothetical protein
LPWRNGHGRGCCAFVHPWFQLDLSWGGRRSELLLLRRGLRLRGCLILAIHPCPWHDFVHGGHRWVRLIRWCVLWDVVRGVVEAPLVPVFIGLVDEVLDVAVRHRQP